MEAQLQFLHTESAIPSAICAIIKAMGKGPLSVIQSEFGEEGVQYANDMCKHNFLKTIIEGGEVCYVFTDKPLEIEKEPELMP